MSDCKPIPGLILDDESYQALRRIKKTITSGKFLATAVSVGVFSNIFTKNNVALASYNVTQTDWVLYAQSMKAIPIIVKTTIRKEIEQMVINYQLNYSRKHLLFWKGMYDGCQQN
jgi:hypothetical protein